MLKITADNLRIEPKRMELVVENLEKGFGDKPVLSGADFVFEQGKIYGLLGRNGAGKTTLFNCLGGEIQTDGGRMKLVQGDDTRDLQPEDVGYVYSLSR